MTITNKFQILIRIKSIYPEQHILYFVRHDKMTKFTTDINELCFQFLVN